MCDWLIQYNVTMVVTIVTKMYFLDLLFNSQLDNGNQLSGFLLHFVASNF